MPSVTVNGASGQYVVVNYDTAAYQSLAARLLTDSGNWGPGSSAGFLASSTSDTIPAGSVVTGVGNLDTPTGAGLGTVYVTDQSTATDQLVLDGTGTNMLFSATGGGGTILTGSGNDTISVASGWLVRTEGSGDKIFASGTDTIVAGGANTIVASGNDTVFGGTGGANVYGGSNGALTYVAGSGNDTVTPGAGNLTAFDGAGGTTYDITIGLATIVAGAGTSLATDSATINGGSGETTYFGNDYSSLTFTGDTNNNLFVAGTGQETINGSGSTGSNVFFAGAGNDSITGGKDGANILWAGNGNDTLTGGGPGYNLFGFVQEAGNNSDTITDWNSTDHLDLSGVSITDQQVENGNLIMTLSDNTTVTFTGVTSDISSSQYTVS
jgi:Ca2+-binding RTX toxin-like protein